MKGQTAKEFTVRFVKEPKEHHWSASTDGVSRYSGLGVTPEQAFTDLLANMTLRAIADVARAQRKAKR